MNTITNGYRLPLKVLPNDIAESLTGRPHITYSEIRTYQSCPLKWQFQYVDKLEMEQFSAAMLLGTCVHAAIQRILESLIASEAIPSIDELMIIYRETWVRESRQIPIQYSKGQDAQTSEATAKRMIECFLDSDLSKPKGEIVGIEESFKVKLAEDLPDLAGRVDLMTYDGESLLITDFKTARSIPTEEAAEDMAEQLILYSKGCKPIADSLSAEIKLRYVYLTKTKETKIEEIRVTLDIHRAKRSILIAGRIFEAMKRGIIYPAPSVMNCSGCAYKKACIKWHNGNILCFSISDEVPDNKSESAHQV